MNRQSFYPKINKSVLILSDFMCCIISIMAAYYFSPEDDFSLTNEALKGSITKLEILFSIVLLMVAVIWVTKRHYSYRKPFGEEVKDLFNIITFFALATLSIFSILLDKPPLITLFYIFAFMIVLFPIVRLCTKLFLIKINTWQLECAVICSNEDARKMYQLLTKDVLLGYNVVSIISIDRDICKNEDIAINDLYCSHQYFIDNIHSYQRIFIVPTLTKPELLDNWLKEIIKFNYRNISISYPLDGVPVYGTDISYFLGSDIFLLRLNNNLAKRSSQFIKRACDVLISSLLLTILGPIILFILLFIKNGIYSQVRVGRNGKAFRCYKLRTMKLDASEQLKRLLDSNLYARLEWNKYRKLKNDPRITKVGKILREFSIDEIPQLWNVLRGDMSLVGPRPVTRYELHFYQENSIYYKMVRPGISGIWQISGRSDTEYNKRVALDVWYVKNWSMWIDITILIKTIGVVIKRRGAY